MVLPVSLSACGKGALSWVCIDDAVVSIKQIVSFRLVLIICSVRDLPLLQSSWLLRERLDTFFYLTYVIDLCPQQYANCLKTNNTKIHSFKKNKPKLYWYKTACVLNMLNIIHTAFIPLCACFTPSPFQVGYNHSSSAWKECTHKTDILK